MALIKCTNCGHSISDKAVKCPKCGTPVHKKEEINPSVQKQQVKETIQTYHAGDIQQDKKRKTWMLVGILLVVLAVVALVYFGMSGSSDKADTAEVNDSIEVAGVETSEEKVSNTTNILADGEYCYKGDWESKNHAAQPCKVEFVKKDNALLNCAYTNLKYDARIPLDGTIEDNKLHFVGNINGKQLVIDLEVSPDGNTLNGKGVDHAHSGDEAKLNLEKTDALQTALSFRTFTEKATENTQTYQNRLSEGQVVKNLKGIGFELTDSRTESRPDYTGEDYNDITIETYSKTVNGHTTTVKLESDYTEICFPSRSDVDKFIVTVRAADLTETADGFKDNEEVYWAGTDVYVNGTTVKLNYKSEP